MGKTKPRQLSLANRKFTLHLFEYLFYVFSPTLTRENAVVRAILF